jgi:catechol 2,3-dioxygenase-like lactoylglutathione lyase family enzyme
MSDHSAPIAATEPLDAHDLGASLTVRDLERSFAWYRDTLGFTLDRKHERHGSLIAISLKAGTARVLLTQDDGAKGLDRLTEALAGRGIQPRGLFIFAVGLASIGRPVLPPG